MYLTIVGLIVVVVGAESTLPSPTHLTSLEFLSELVGPRPGPGSEMTVVWKIVPQKIDPNVGSHPLIKDPAAGPSQVPQTIIPDIRLKFDL